MDPRKIRLGEVVAPGIIFLFSEFAFMYLFRLLIPFTEQVVHGDRDTAGNARAQTEGTDNLYLATDARSMTLAAGSLLVEL